MCTPNNIEGGVCSGIKPGMCPNFASMPQQAYNKIQPVCTFFPPQKGNKCINESIPNQAGKLVACHNLQITDDEGNVTKEVNGIYGCVDAEMLQSNKAYYDVWGKDVVEEQLKSCMGDNGKLCNGAGTCKPNGDFQKNYTCACNKGYGGENCANATGMECDFGGGCQAGTCQKTLNGLLKCVCPAGTGGAMCSECAESTDENKPTCNGHGTCNADSKKCECEENWAGTFCQTSNPKTPASTSADSGSSSASLASPPLVAAGIIAATIAAAFL